MSNNYYNKYLDCHFTTPRQKPPIQYVFSPFQTVLNVKINFTFLQDVVYYKRVIFYNIHNVWRQPSSSFVPSAIQVK